MILITPPEPTTPAPLRISVSPPSYERPADIVTFPPVLLIFFELVSPDLIITELPLCDCANPVIIDIEPDLSFFELPLNIDMDPVLDRSLEPVEI